MHRRDEGGMLPIQQAGTQRPQLTTPACGLQGDAAPGQALASSSAHPTGAAVPASVSGGLPQSGSASPRHHWGVGGVNNSSANGAAAAPSTMPAAGHEREGELGLRGPGVAGAPHSPFDSAAAGLGGRPASSGGLVGGWYQPGALRARAQGPLQPSKLAPAGTAMAAPPPHHHHTHQQQHGAPTTTTTN